MEVRQSYRAVQSGGLHATEDEKRLTSCTALPFWDSRAWPHRVDHVVVIIECYRLVRECSKWPSKIYIHISKTDAIRVGLKLLVYIHGVCFRRSIGGLHTARLRGGRARTDTLGRLWALGLGVSRGIRGGASQVLVGSPASST